MGQKHYSFTKLTPVICNQFFVLVLRFTGYILDYYIILQLSVLTSNSVTSFIYGRGSCVCFKGPPYSMNNHSITPLRSSDICITCRWILVGGCKFTSLCVWPPLLFLNPPDVSPDPASMYMGWYSTSDRGVFMRYKSSLIRLEHNLEYIHCFPQAPLQYMQLESFVAIIFQYIGGVLIDEIDYNCRLHTIFEEDWQL